MDGEEKRDGVSPAREMGCKVINACQKWGKHGGFSWREIRDKVTDLALKRGDPTRPFESRWQQGEHRQRHQRDRLETRQETCCCFGLGLFCCVQGVDTRVGEQSFIPQFLLFYTTLFVLSH